MVRPHLPLNALRAFEASARHLSFTLAAIELCVTQAAISHQVKGLEEKLGHKLFRRLPRGLALTDEGLALLPTLVDSFDRIADALEHVGEGRAREVLTVGAVSTFATGWLIPRLPALAEACPALDLRLFTNNNRVDIAAEGLDFVIRFGDGAWHGTEAVKLMEAPFAPLCTPSIAARLSAPADLLRATLLRSYRSDEWTRWFAAAGIEAPPVRGPVFDSSLAMVDAAAQGLGVALAPPAMFTRLLGDGAIVQPFAAGASAGAYWLTWLKSRRPTLAMDSFRDWIAEAATA
ncbi:LysR family transcriptional regulator [Sphingosinicella sp. BN140058]|uniref:LysR family transcriptional regulator n=1 Tax=Sphingosinicella sp. BN140058 TaxID=1892855 RepID=UPI0010132284|nr:LysR family transcriptional regulator [Sphingosinicella sp. BN140058]QAY77993.1 LysR family transcriptional regulator [Sphingosinicella sp. BN140058]